MTYGDGHGDALRAIIEEAAAARSALCENELVIRLDNILAIARAALDRQGQGDFPDKIKSPKPTDGMKNSLG